MLEEVHETLDAATLKRCSRRELRALLGAYHRVETHAAERRLAVMAALDALDDDGLSAAAEARSVTHRSDRASARDAETATALAAFPAATDALSRGAISVEHAERLAFVAEETSPEQAAELVQLAEQTPADLFRKKSNRWLSTRRSRQAVEERHAQQRAERELSVWWEGGDEDDGALLIRGRMDNATGRSFLTALQATVDRLWRADGGRGGTPNDVRTPTQRRVDALAALAEEPVDSDAPLAVRNMLHLFVNLDGDSVGPAEFVDGQPVPQAFFHSLDPATVDVVGHVFSGDGLPLWTGRRHRLATVHQWPVLIARDRGCTDCGTDPAFTQAHHEIEWELDGTTDIDNLALKCHTDHGLVHQGWQWQRRPEAA